MITIKEVSKKFKNNIIFENLSITFDDGKIIAVSGDNGSGKSVLLKLISGLSLPDKGSISIDEKLLHKDIDFIPNSGIFINSPNFMSSWTGYNNLKYLANIKGIATDEDIFTLAAQLNLKKEDLGKKYRTYSDGMKQKMRIIQAFMDKPKYLILDEPYNSLDRKSVEVFDEMLLKYKEIEPNVLVLLTSHINQKSEIVDEKYELVDYNLYKV